MTSPIREIKVLCPGCGTEYTTYFRASMNLQLDDFDDAYIEKMATATCPHCKLKVDLGTLIVDEDGAWHV